MQLLVSNVKREKESSTSPVSWCSVCCPPSANAAFTGLQFKYRLVVELQKAVILSLNFITLYQKQITRKADIANVKCVTLQDI